MIKKKKKNSSKALFFNQKGFQVKVTLRVRKDTKFKTGLCKMQRFHSIDLDLDYFKISFLKAVKVKRGQTDMIQSNNRLFFEGKNFKSLLYLK